MQLIIFGVQMKRTLLKLFLIYSILISFYNAPFNLYAEDLSGSDINSTLFRKGPYLIFNGNNTEYHILWQLTGTKEAFLEWGNDTTYSLNNTTTVEYNSDHQHQYIFNGLIPHNKYYYRITADNEEKTGSFIAAPPDTAKSVKFIAYGDTRSEPGNHDKVVEGILKAFTEDPEYQTVILNPGDLVKEGDQESDWDEQFFDPQYTYITKLLSETGYQVAVGNHERDAVLFNKYFPYPYEETCYWSFDYGPMHVVVIDQFIAEYDSGSAQLQWIEDDLNATSKKWKIFLLHKTGWSTGWHGSDEQTQELLQPICKKYGVKLLLGGHNHIYARAVADGVYHITTGGGGASSGTPNSDDPKIVVTTVKHHFCKIKIAGNDLFLQAIADDGSLIDEFSISLDKSSLNVEVNGGGTVNVSPDSVKYHLGAQVELHAVPSNGWKFDHWEGDELGNENPDTITMNYDKYIKAIFKEDGSGRGENDIEVSVIQSSDDAEENLGSHSVSLSSSDLELIQDGSAGEQLVGIRFQNIDIPKGATIESACIQFTTDEADSKETSLIIKGEAADDAQAFTSESSNISNRPTTTSFVNWDNIRSWDVLDEAGEDQRTPDIKSVIQEIVDRDGWGSGNALAIIISGSGERTARSWDSEDSSDKSAKLIITYSENTTSITDRDKSVIPDNYCLSCYPNPFNPATTIIYNLPESGNVTINIYNVTGKKIRTFISSKYQSKGIHSVKWNGKDDNMNTLSSGIYFIRISTNEISKTIKAALLQ